MRVSSVSITVSGGDHVNARWRPLPPVTINAVKQYRAFPTLQLLVMLTNTPILHHHSCFHIRIPAHKAMPRRARAFTQPSGERFIVINDALPTRDGRSCVIHGHLPQWVGASGAAQRRWRTSGTAGSKKKISARRVFRGEEVR